ncbi:Terminase, ATPase subunit (GpP) [Escherichia coli]|nr:Terminase, ATPase subunit (GpP) [Escherichia coli]
MALRDDVAQPYQRNQIFLSASRRQAFQFKSIIQKAASEVDVELKGAIKSSSPTAQSCIFLVLLLRRHSPTRAIFILMNFSGSVALLNCARWLALWQPSADCGAPTSPRHPPKRTRHTPTGTATAGTRKKATHKRQRFSVDWKTLHNGLICPDRTWRQIVTLEDVVNHGWKTRY